jgi:hypothetical protein
VRRCRQAPAPQQRRSTANRHSQKEIAPTCIIRHRSSRSEILIRDRRQIQESLSLKLGEHFPVDKIIWIVF